MQGRRAAIAAATPVRSRIESCSISSSCGPCTCPRCDSADVRVKPVSAMPRNIDRSVFNQVQASSVTLQGALNAPLLWPLADFRAPRPGPPSHRSASEMLPVAFPRLAVQQHSFLQAVTHPQVSENNFFSAQSTLPAQSCWHQPRRPLRSFAHFCWIHTPCWYIWQ